MSNLLKKKGNCKIMLPSGDQLRPPAESVSERKSGPRKVEAQAFSVGMREKLEKGKPSGGDDLAWISRDYHGVGTFLAVFDGLSEGGKGSAAAGAAQKKLAELVEKRFGNNTTDYSTTPELRDARKDAILQLIKEVHKHVVAAGEDLRTQGKLETGHPVCATTLCLALIDAGYNPQTGQIKDFLETYSVGDSFCFAISPDSGEVIPIGFPDTLEGYLAKGEVKKEGGGQSLQEEKKFLQEAIAKNGKSSRIFGGLGFGFEKRWQESPDKVVNYKRTVIPPGTVVALTTDEVAMAVFGWETEVVKTAFDPKHPLQRVAFDLVNKTPPSDDRTAIVAKVSGS